MRPPIIILDRVVREVAKDAAKDILCNVANGFQARAYENDRSSKYSIRPFKNKRLKKKWYNSLAMRIRHEIRNLDSVVKSDIT